MARQATSARLRVAVLVSGSGTTFAALADAFVEPASRAEIVLLIASREDVPAIALARRRGIAHTVTDAKAIGSEASDTFMLDALHKHGVELVVLAGYLRKVGPQTLSAFPGAIINTHPAPLPHFGGKGMYGDRVHREVLDAGVAMSAATLHLADAEYDTGPVIARRTVSVRPGDDVASLRARVQIAEREQLIETIAAWPVIKGSLMSSRAELRHSVRVLLLDEEDRLLLFRAEDPEHGRAFWFPPGGGLEEGEDVQAAAAREVAEETGLRDLELGPEVWRRRHEFSWRGKRFDQRERWFMARVGHFAASGAAMTETEKVDLTACRWWTLDELDATDDDLTPRDLAAQLRTLLAEGPPPHPFDVGV